MAIPFDELPVLPAAGLRYAWDVYGLGDNLGTLNRLTPDVVAAAAGAVRTGERIGISLPLELPDPPFFGRQALRHTVFAMAENARDDRVDNFYPQCSSQWDGLRHVRLPDGFYGGWRGDPAAAAQLAPGIAGTISAIGAADPEPLGIHHWARHGIVGRGVLADLAAARGGAHADDADHAVGADHGYDPFTLHRFEPAEVESALRAQGASLRAGDILCVRTGWMDKYLRLDSAARAKLSGGLASPHGYHCAGLSGSEEMSRYLWDSGIAAVAADNPAVEAVPGDPALGSLHQRLIPALGFAIGELFDFTALSRACRRDGRYDFLFVSVPLNLTGGVGSPANAVAIR